MEVNKFIDIIGADFYTGVPDSQLKSICDYLMNKYGVNQKHHIIAANEGNCVAIAAGYHLATYKIPVVYMQNSGEGNIINPVTSLLNDNVYAIPIIFIIGWRGEPGTHDEPQHIHQGKVTIKLLEDVNIKSFIVSKETTENELKKAMNDFQNILSNGKDVAFIIRKGALSYDKDIEYKNNNLITREEIIQHILKFSDKDPIISTTGKVSRELFEARIINNQSHKYDFLNVGSMGHSSSIALGIAINKPRTKVWCVDGDGSVLMHMGSIAIIGENAPKNFIHIVINNSAHETVGGIPTVADKIDFISIAKACGYINTLSVNNFKDLDKALEYVKRNDELSMIEVKCSISSRANLSRPTISTLENKLIFMEYLKNKN